LEQLGCLDVADFVVKVADKHGGFGKADLEVAPMGWRVWSRT
jgi:hypothetical protein